MHITPVFVEIKVIFHLSGGLEKGMRKCHKKTTQGSDNEPGHQHPLPI
jgi:hypothetical protein